MPTAIFTNNLQRHVKAARCDACGSTVNEVLDSVFSQNPNLRHYILDDQGSVRKHVVIFLDSNPIADRTRLNDPVRPDAEILVMQALSGG